MAGRSQLDRIEERQAAIAEGVYALLLSQVLHADEAEAKLLVAASMELRRSMSDRAG